MEELPPVGDPLEVKPLILLDALTGFFSPQILKLIDYIKHRKVIILFDSGNTHSFFHRYITQEINCYISAVNNFQIMISNSGSMKCGDFFGNVHLQFGQYHLKYHVFSIDMGYCEIMLSVEWLHTLNPITMDFKELSMKFQQEGQQYKFQGIIVGSPKINTSHLLKFHA